MTIKALTRITLGLALLAGCDPTMMPREQTAARPAAEPGSAPAPAPAAPAEAPQAVAAPQAPAEPPPADLLAVVHDYGQCYSGCFAEHVRATDKETCKLNCEALAEAARDGLPGAPSKDVLLKAIAALDGCVYACYEDASLSATNRETCLLTCRDVADVSASAPPSAEHRNN